MPKSHATNSIKLINATKPQANNVMKMKIALTSLLITYLTSNVSIFCGSSVSIIIAYAQQI